MTAAESGEEAGGGNGKEMLRERMNQRCLIQTSNFFIRFRSPVIMSIFFLVILGSAGVF